MSKYSLFLKIMQHAARKAETRLIRDFMELGSLQISIKNDKEFVTNADKQSEEIIFNEITKKMQNYGLKHSFLMEESGFVGRQDAEFCFIVDPLDGTYNFMHGIPYFAISIAAQHKINDTKKIVAALIHSPITRETFHAEHGNGAFYTDINSNSHKMHVRTKTSLQEALISTSLSHQKKEYYNFIHQITIDGAHIRSTGSTSMDLAYLANGRYDAVIYPRSKIWDYAAGYLLVNEAGGFFTRLTQEAENEQCANSIIASSSFNLYSKINNTYKTMTG